MVVGEEEAGRNGEVMEIGEMVDLVKVVVVEQVLEMQHLLQYILM